MNTNRIFFCITVYNLRRELNTLESHIYLNLIMLKGLDAVLNKRIF